MKAFVAILFSLLSLAGPAQVVSNPVKARTGIVLRFHHVAGGAPLYFDSVYHTSGGEELTIRKFRYYISGISFINEKGKPVSFPNDYFLIDQSKPETQNITLAVPAGKYKILRFLIGVDSLRNVSGAQTGVLDPVMDMFWTWNTGYVTAKLEGTSPLSALPNNRIEYHIGGFKQPYNTVRKIDLSFPVQVLSSGKTLAVTVAADVLAWFGPQATTSIKVKPACTTPGAAASAWADNYARMFSIKEVRLF